MAQKPSNPNQKPGAFGNKVVREDVLAAFNRGDKAALVSIMPEPAIEPHVSSPPPPVPPQHRATAITPPQQPAISPQPPPVVVRPRPVVAIAPRPVVVLAPSPAQVPPLQTPAVVVSPPPAVSAPQLAPPVPIYPPAYDAHGQLLNPAQQMLFDAVEYDDVVAAGAALSMGADVNAEVVFIANLSREQSLRAPHLTTTSDRGTPLKHAIYRGSPAVAGFLQQKGGHE